MRIFFRDIKHRLTELEEKGDIFLANEISANYMVGSMMALMEAIVLVLLALNEMNVFVAAKDSVRSGALFAFIIALPSLVIAGIKRGEGKYIRQLLLTSVTLQCASFLAFTGQNATLTMVVPVLLSIRYYKPRVTFDLAHVSVLLFAAAELAFAYIGSINANSFQPEVGTVITIETSLKNALIPLINENKASYISNLFSYEFIPRLVSYFAVCGVSYFVSLRGKQLLELQNSVVSKNVCMSTELELAEKIQWGVLPHSFDTVNNSGNVEIYAKYQPAKEVGGDFYDFFIIDENRIGIVVADVSGKGMGSALLMMAAKTAIKDQLLSGAAPAQALTSVNRRLAENNDANLFVTVWAGVYDKTNRTVTYANAGHNHPAVRHENNEVEYLRTRTGFVLAALIKSQYTQAQYTFSQGDMLLLYTDGVTEARTAERHMFGEERLTKSLIANNGSCNEIITAILSDINEFTVGNEQFDDITMLAMKVK